MTVSETCSGDAREASAVRLASTLDVAEGARLFKALSDPTRLSILRELRDRGEVCACDFVGCCGGGLGQPTVSHHLRVLREAGLIEGDKRGQWVWYRANPATLERLRAYLP